MEAVKKRVERESTRLHPPALTNSSLCSNGSGFSIAPGLGRAWNLHWSVASRGAAPMAMREHLEP